MVTKQQATPGTRVWRLDLLTGGFPTAGTIAAGDCQENEVLVETETSVSAVPLDKLQLMSDIANVIVISMPESEFNLLDGKLGKRLAERAYSVTTFRPGNKAYVSKTRVTPHPRGEISHADGVELLRDTIRTYAGQQ